MIFTVFAVALFCSLTSHVLMDAVTKPVSDDNKLEELISSYQRTLTDSIRSTSWSLISLYDRILSQASSKAAKREFELSKIKERTCKKLGKFSKYHNFDQWCVEESLSKLHLLEWEKNLVRDDCYGQKMLVLNSYLMDALEDFQALYQKFVDATKIISCGESCDEVFESVKVRFSSVEGSINDIGLNSRGQLENITWECLDTEDNFKQEAEDVFQEAKECLEPSSNASITQVAFIAAVRKSYYTPTDSFEEIAGLVDTKFEYALKIIHRSEKSALKTLQKLSCSQYCILKSAIRINLITRSAYLEVNQALSRARRGNLDSYNETHDAYKKLYERALNEEENCEGKVCDGGRQIRREVRQLNEEAGKDALLVLVDLHAELTALVEKNSDQIDQIVEEAKNCPKQ